MNTVFTPYKLGNITLRNRTVRSAAFENMCRNYSPSQELYDYHTAVAKGGIGMTTVAYVSVNRSGVSFDGQMWMRKEIIPELKKLTASIHAEGAKASIQLGHCGNMTHRRTAGQMPVGASGGFNLYSPTFCRALTREEIKQTVIDFGEAVEMAREADFDAVEIHAGHGYLISQFLSPYTNHRKDEYGGTLQNRMRFMTEVLQQVIKAAEGKIAVIVKTNMYDGFRKGMKLPDCITVAKRIEELKVDAIVLSAGFVSKAPMVVMRGAMPLKTLAYYMDMRKYWWLKAMIRLFGRIIIPTVPFKEKYFLEDAKKFRAELKLPLIYVGGLTSRKAIEEVLESGFELVQMARVLVNDTDFVNKMRAADMEYKSGCKHSNYCIGRMYSKNMQCHHCIESLPKKIEIEIKKMEKR
ncbi:MAG: NADH:flavin oxidoreductase [Bacteroidales bacterium]|jgi:2,4-dienoyl-CoA reductase-like NADH-dependent reductase (Old Yellow Enzyme family)|nr:NADH:flavin oxidoreductase [Bacteroidales bacterium]